jgi:hypothetical protein
LLSAIACKRGGKSLQLMKVSSREREREREREPQVPEVVEVHENAGNMLSNAKEKTFKCSSALEAGLTVVLQHSLMQIVGYSSSTMAISTHVCRIIN